VPRPPEGAALPARSTLSPLDGGAAFAVVLIWAFNFIAGKVGVMQVPPLFLMAVRFALIALMLIPFLRRPAGRWGMVLAISFVLGGLHFGLMFVGLRGVAAGPAAIAIQLTVPFSAILAAIFYKERLGRWQMAGMLVAFAGIWVLAGEPTERPSSLHFLMVVLAAFAWAAANVLIKRLGPINVFTLNGWVALFACPQMLLASLLLERGQLQALAAADWRVWGAVVYMAVCSSIIAYGLWYYLIEKHEMNRIVPLTLLSPVLAVALAVPFLGEPLTLHVLAGGGITLAGVAMIQFLRGASSASAPS
jgi:O-acetylserine/cysteine efflux transporter